MSAAAGVTSRPASGTSSPARGATGAGALTPGSAAMMDDASGGNSTRLKKRGKASALLRDYYGLGGGLSTANEDPTDPGAFPSPDHLMLVTRAPRG